MKTITVGDRFVTEDDLKEMFREYVWAEAMDSIHHEHVSAWGAPSECHDLVSKGHEKRMLQIEETFGVSIGNLLSHFGQGVIVRCIERVYDIHNPFN